MLLTYGVLFGMLAAQRAADARPIFPSLSPGELLQVTVSGGPRMSGRYVGMSGDTLFLHTNATLQPVRTLAIDSLWTRHRPIVREGIHGMVIGVVVGSATLLVQALPHIFDCWRFDVFGPSTPCHSRVRLHASTIAFTTGIGTALGALAGLISPEWKRRIP